MLVNGESLMINYLVKIIKTEVIKLFSVIIISVVAKCWLPEKFAG